MKVRSEEFQRYLARFPDMTPVELSALKAWIQGGNDPHGNPCLIADEHGVEMDFISAWRVMEDMCAEMSES